MNRVAAATLALLALALALASHALAKDANRPLFESEAPLAVTLQAPWSDVLKRAKQPVRHAAVLGYADARGKAHRIATTVETRGLTRLRVCRFPPLRIRFAKGAAAGSDFAGQDALKMVTHCDTPQAFSQYYVQELLAYRIYNRVTERSFRVRALDATYQDPDGGNFAGPRFAFVVEDVGDMARRNGLERDRKARFAPADYDSLALSRFMLFQYLIGNTDWDVTTGPQSDECCHNVRVIGADGQKRIPVPYDFDSAGMVATNYSAPAASLPIKDVRQRLYRGLCSHNDTLEAARQEFLGHRQAFLALVQAEARLNSSRKRALTGYFEDFYATLGDDAKFASEISGKCRK